MLMLFYLTWSVFLIFLNISFLDAGLLWNGYRMVPSRTRYQQLKLPGGKSHKISGRILNTLSQLLMESAPSTTCPTSNHISKRTRWMTKLLGSKNLSCSSPTLIGFMAPVLNSSINLAPVIVLFVRPLSKYCLTPQVSRPHLSLAGLPHLSQRYLRINTNACLSDIGSWICSTSQYAPEMFKSKSSFSTERVFKTTTFHESLMAIIVQRPMLMI